MDNRPIGFFDSGIGGLTSIPYIMENLPQEQIIFFGDTARTPYGSKNIDTIRQFSLQISHFLVKKNVKMIVIACNTASAASLDILRSEFPDIPVIGVISPTAKVISKVCSEKEHIGVIATKATVKTEAYEKKIKKYNPELQVYSKACPAFVPLIEEGLIDNRIMYLTVKYYLDDFIKDNHIDSLVLGCTHYPLLKDIIEELYPHVKIINSSEEVANAVEIELKERDMLAEERAGENVFYASDISDNFVPMVKRILGDKAEPLNIKFKNMEDPAI